ncbi:PQ loop repeat-domain-containing protein [Sporodiniella umbellata]|nr:PQ loop repeat-domain-containing protein [Sporodiniella umbellata]
MSLCPISPEGIEPIAWIHNVLGGCVYSKQECISLLFGYLSIFFWLNAQMPQVIKNYRLRNADSLSFSFLVVWTIGDIANFIGCVITGQLPFQCYLSVYYTIIDTILCGQWLYYVRYTDNRLRRWFDQAQEEPKPVTEEEPIYTTYSVDSVVARKKEANERTPLTSKQGGKNYVTMLVVSGFLFNTSSHLKDTVESTLWVGRFFAWLCTFLYLSSRLPQIYQNFRRRSCQGLSMALFFCAAMGNLTYVLSICTNPHATRASMLEAVPFLIGSAGTLIFDLTIFIQYALFQHSTQPLQLV